MNILTKLILLMFVLNLLSCQRAVIKPTVVESESQIERAERIGEAIFEKDSYAAKATDVILLQGPAQNDDRVKGWITVKENDEWLVRFVGVSSEKYVALYDVRFPNNILQPVDVIQYNQATYLPPEQVSMFAARQTAIAAVPKKCSDRYNTVVLKDNISEADIWSVYILAATTNPGEIMVGGHFRVEVSSNGSEIINIIPLSKSCFRMPQPEDGDPKFAYMTHVLSEKPIETHVFLNLVHKKPFYVITSLGVWKIVKGKISFAGKLPSQKNNP